jgi:glycosyl transferase family 2
MFEKVTFAMTSCGRSDLLEPTIASFISYNTYPIYRYVIIDDSGNKDEHKKIEKILDKFKIPYVLILNLENFGQVKSLDRLYSEINTEYIWHTEDDWETISDDAIRKSLDLLKCDGKICNVNTRIRFDGEKGSMHPIEPLQKTRNGTEYHNYVVGYEGIWNGFSWNPGLRRLSDYKTLGNFQQYKNEQGVGQKFKDLGFHASCLKDAYCKHIGTYSHTPKPNQ